MHSRAALLDHDYRGREGFDGPARPQLGDVIRADYGLFIADKAFPNRVRLARIGYAHTTSLPALFRVPTRFHADYWDAALPGSRFELAFAAERLWPEIEPRLAPGWALSGFEPVPADDDLVIPFLSAKASSRVARVTLFGREYCIVVVGDTPPPLAPAGAVRAYYRAQWPGLRWTLDGPPPMVLVISTPFRGL